MNSKTGAPENFAAVDRDHHGIVGEAVLQVDGQLRHVESPGYSATRATVPMTACALVCGVPLGTIVTASGLGDDWPAGSAVM